MPIMEGLGAVSPPTIALPSPPITVRWVLRRGRGMATRGVISLADQAASSAATFLTGAIVGHTCPRAYFGLFALSLTVLAWVTNMQSAFITTPYVYANAALEPEARRGYAGSTLVGQIGYGILTTILLLVIAWCLTGTAKYAAFAPILAALGAMLWFQLVKEYCRQIAFAHLNVTSALWLDASVGVLQIGGLLALASIGAMSAARAYWIIGVASIIPSIWWLAANRRAFVFDRAAFRPAARRNWEFGRWIPGGYVMNAASRDSYPWLVTALRGAASTGTLAASTGTAFLVTPIITGISNVLAPAFAKKYATGGIPALRRIVAIATVLGLLGMACYCLVMFFIGGWVVSLVYGHAYASEGHIVALLTLSVAATVASTPVGMAMYVLRRADVNFYAAGMAVMVMLVLGIAFVHWWGVVGAAAALVCGTAAESLYKWLRYESVLRADAARSAQ